MPKKKLNKNKSPKSSKIEAVEVNAPNESIHGAGTNETTMDLLAVGMSVEICRSDGRVHAAVISSLKPDSKMVDVEWFESGETKGKSIDLATLIRHNPKIAGLLGRSEDLSRPSKDVNKAKRKTLSVAQPFVESNPDGGKNGVQTRPREVPLMSDLTLQPTSPPTAKSVKIVPSETVHKAVSKKVSDVLSVGMSVEISRSDGRVHAAMISALKPDSKMVDVEWFENGETKGKSIDLATLGRDNPKIAELLGRSEDLSRPSKEMNKGKRKTLSVAQPLVENNRDSGKNGVQARNREAREMPPLVELSPDSPPPRPPPMPVRCSEVLAPVAKHQVVLKTEEIERNREERRAQRMAEKRKRDDLKNLDPGNPHFEFLKMIRDYRAPIEFRPLKMTDEVVDNRICVCVRKRPLGRRELNNKEIDVVTIPTKDHVIVHQPQTKVDLTKYLENQKFRFDYTFDETVDNEMVYRFTAQPLIKTIFDGGFATCFAYGQTGSGKTHTMGGDFEGKSQDCTKGIYALAAIDVFNYLNLPEFDDDELYVACSFFELYGAKAFDLLSKRAALRIMEDNKHNVQIVGLKEQTVASADEVLKLIQQGSSLRTAGQTSANANSSRSHAVFQIVLKRYDNDAIHGKFSLIDLAGNERGADTTSSDRQTRMEGAEINKSLLSLKECIRAMGMMKDYVPFRGSKLTLVLRDSFIGRNAKTCMIATISPGLLSTENTLNTLRYANRAKELDSEDIEQQN
ncbi:Kinesin-like protein [Aphelenchoides besseyi]|nr:Kinesin-like protein [Aphelenchoides besseyi]